MGIKLLFLKNVTKSSLISKEFNIRISFSIVLPHNGIRIYVQIGQII